MDDLPVDVPFPAAYNEDTNEVTIFEYIPASERGNSYFWITRQHGGVMRVSFEGDELRLREVSAQQAVILLYELIALKDRAKEI